VSFTAFPGTAPLAKQADTGPAGFALQNATPAIISWTAPADGNDHRVTLFGVLEVTTLQVGGAVAVSFTDPGGNAHSFTVLAGALAAGGHGVAATSYVIQSGTTVTLAQTSAQTAGASTLWAEIWGS
jgi:hypothetical protein